MANDSTYGQVLQLPNRRVRSLAEQRDVGQASSLPIGLDSLQEALVGRSFDPAATALILATLKDATAPILWAQDRYSRCENGRIYMAGLLARGIGAPILHVDVNHPRDVLWAMEEGAACRGLSAVVGEIHGAPAVLDFTATKRLALRAESSGVPLWLIRSNDPGTLSASRSRWRVASLPSMLHRYDPAAPGEPVWDADLFKARARSPGRWTVRNDPEPSHPADGLHLVPRSGDGEMADERPAIAAGVR